MRRARPAARVIEIPAGAASATALPAFDDGEIIVVLGLCGALRRLHAGDTAIYRSIAGTAQRFTVDAALASATSDALAAAFAADACTAERVVTTMTERAVLAQRYDADVVDMEGTHLAVALAARGARFAMVRVVSDDASRDLPAIGDAIDAHGRVRPLQLVLAFARAPRAAFAFVRGVRRALATLTRVTRAIEGVR